MHKLAEASLTDINFYYQEGLVNACQALLCAPSMGKISRKAKPAQALGLKLIQLSKTDKVILCYQNIK